MDIYEEIKAERKRQDVKWGGPSHDDRHTLSEWQSFIKKHATRIAHPLTDSDARKHLVRVAALAVAAVESFDRGAAKAGSG